MKYSLNEVPQFGKGTTKGIRACEEQNKEELCDSGPLEQTKKGKKRKGQ